MEPFGKDVGARARVAAAVAAGTLAWLAALPAASAEAAVRTCQAARSSGIVKGVTENDGKRRAITAWMAKVRPLGPRYMGWGTATQRILKCVRAKAGGYECIALAMPCTVEQNPGPPGRPRPPQGRRRPGDPGRPIET